jgi:hypothetical protein
MCCYNNVSNTVTTVSRTTVTLHCYVFVGSGLAEPQQLVAWYIYTPSFIFLTADGTRMQSVAASPHKVRSILLARSVFRT